MDNFFKLTFSLPLDTLTFLSLPCLICSLHLLMRSTLSQSVAVVMEMLQASGRISNQNSGVQGLVRWVSVGVGSQWGSLFIQAAVTPQPLGKGNKTSVSLCF